MLFILCLTFAWLLIYALFQTVYANETIHIMVEFGVDTFLDS